MLRTLWSNSKGEKGGRTEVVESFGNQSREGKTIFPVRVLLLMHLAPHGLVGICVPLLDRVLRSHIRSGSHHEEDQACHRRHRDGQAARRGRVESRVSE
jgi:hypothetical protein